MPQENQPKPALTLEEVARVAQEVILRDGYHLPTVIADGTQNTLITQVEGFAPTHEARAQQLFLLGAILAEQADFGVLQQVFLVTEAWMREMPQHSPTDFTQLNDLPRKEVLTISRLALYPPQTEVVVFEMKRDAAGTLTTLGNINHQAVSERSAESPLLEAFAIGFLGSALKPDD